MVMIGFLHLSKIWERTCQFQKQDETHIFFIIGFGIFMKYQKNQAILIFWFFIPMVAKD